MTTVVCRCRGDLGKGARSRQQDACCLISRLTVNSHPACLHSVIVIFQVFSISDVLFFFLFPFYQPTIIPVPHPSVETCRSSFHIPPPHPSVPASCSLYLPPLIYYYPVPLPPHCPSSVLHLSFSSFSSTSLSFLLHPLILTSFRLPSPFHTCPLHLPVLLSSPAPFPLSLPLSPPPHPPEVVSVRGSSGGLKVRGSSSSVQSLLQSYGSSLRKPRSLGRSLSSYLNHTTRLGTDATVCVCVCACVPFVFCPRV